jgi:voltage-gated potassium channel Kch
MMSFLRKIKNAASGSPFLKSLFAGAGFLLFLAFGVSWVTLARLVPDGVSGDVAVVALGVVFVGTFLYLLMKHIQNVLTGVEKPLPVILMTLFNLALLILAFAWIYSMIGIINNRPDGSGEAVYDFFTCVYFSMVTLTTLGYGDYVPQGAGQYLAAVEAMTGYIILGLLASSSATILQRQAQEHEEKNEQQEDEQE